ncbi:MAG: acyl-CoA thioester hydrolase/BAAT C-terminal domain-containing protein, partial [Bacteroidota bacterium]
EKSGNEERPLIVFLSGSRAGFIRKDAIHGLVRSGYDILSLAYFGLKGLPQNLEAVPFEYLDGAIKWAKIRFPDRKIVLMGVSKGAEYALSYASYLPNVDGLIAYGPSAIVIPNHVGVPEEQAYHSSWTYQGQEVPFANIKRFDDPAGRILYNKYINPILLDEKELNHAEIKMGAVDFPIMLLSGKNDLVWPAYKMSRLLEDQMSALEKSELIKVIGYEDCGHQFLWFDEQEPSSKDVATSQTIRLEAIKKHRFPFGGTKKGTINAMIQSRTAVLDFLASID